MQALVKSQYSLLVQSVDIEAIDVKHKTFNDELVSSHFAIIPTTKQYQGKVVQRLKNNYIAS